MYKFDSSSCDEYAHMFYHILFYPEKLRTSFIRTKGVCQIRFGVSREQE